MLVPSPLCWLPLPATASTATGFLSSHVQNVPVPSASLSRPQGPIPTTPAPCCRAWEQREGWVPWDGDEAWKFVRAFFFFFFLSFSAWILITGLNLQARERERSNVQVTGGRGGGTNRKDSRASFRVKSSTGVWMGRCWQRAVLPGRPGCVQSSWGGCRDPPRPALAPQRDSCSAAVVPSFPHRCLDPATSLSPCMGGLGHARACRNISRNKVEVFLNTLFLCHPQSGPFSFATAMQPRSFSAPGLAFPLSPALLPSSALAPVAVPAPLPLTVAPVTDS